MLDQGADVGLVQIGAESAHPFGVLAPHGLGDTRDESEIDLAFLVAERQQRRVSFVLGEAVDRLGHDRLRLGMGGWTGSAREPCGFDDAARR